MSVVVVDTNVAVVANDAMAVDPAWDPGCALACVVEIRNIVEGRQRLVVDDLGLMAAEYFRRLDLRGMPGVGDQFAKWVHDTQWDSSQCDRVVITVDGDSFKEFPADPALDGFDPADRKFIAVTCAHPDGPEVLQAVDSKWWGARSDLRRAGVRVRFVCLETIRALHAGKRKHGDAR